MSHELPAFGLRNTGVICYFNSVLQSVLSCTSFIEAIKKLDPQNVKNPIMLKFIGIIKLTDKLVENKEQENKEQENKEQENSDITTALQNISPTIWREMVVFLCRKNKTDYRTFLSGQQCAREGFHCLMDSLDSFNVVQNLFIHRYRSLVRCFKCDDWVSDKECVYSLFEVQPDLKTPQIDQFKGYDLDLYTKGQTMNEFLQKQPGYIEDFNCPKCKDRSVKYSVRYLVMAPEILVVLSKKYVAGRKLDVYTEFPEHMEFSSADGALKYTAVAQIEHAGGLNGGHYWASCKRRGGWKTLNDTGVSEGGFKPTNNTYMVFYHLTA